MNIHAFMSLPAKVAGRLRRRLNSVSNFMLPRSQSLLFVFGGRTLHWNGMGKELYAKESVFRNSIEECDGIICRLGGASILSNFQGTADNNFLDNEANVINAITALEIALADLWLSKHIYPHAVMGVSLGELAAVYTAGGLSKEDALKVAASIAFINKLEEKAFVVLHLHAGLARALQLCKNCPRMHLIYERGDCDVLVFCDEKDQAAVVSFLHQEGITWQIYYIDCSFPYHTFLILRHKEALLPFTRDIEPKPLKCTYFSSNMGRVVSKGELVENSFWFQLKCQPVLIHSTLRLVHNAGHRLMLHIGPHPFLKSQLEQHAGGKKGGVQLLDSMRRGENELEVFEEARKKIVYFQQSGAVLDNEENTFQFFRRQLNLSVPPVSTNPYPCLRILQKKGSVHFLPTYQAFIVLDYQDIQWVLKNPHLFSSTVNQDFDAYLIGADPPAHTLIRSLLQPLFSKPVLASLEAYTNTQATGLLASLPKEKEINFVDAFSLPLTQSVVARFLGLSAANEQEIAACIKGYIYGLEYLDELEAWFHAYLEQYEVQDSNSAASLLLSAIQEGHLNLVGAAKVMRTMWLAGITTSSMLISNLVYLLANDPALAQKLRNEEHLIPVFIEECLRLEAPESETTRITTGEVRLGGVSLPAGTIVMLGIRAANRDPQYFPEPETIRFDRPAKRHLSFGGGFHYCMGAPMARIEATEAIKAVLRSNSALQLAEEDPVTYFPSSHFRGLCKLIVTINRHSDKKHERCA